MSPTIIGKCRQKFSQDKSKSFEVVDQYRNQVADLVLSLDVIFHLVEDDIFHTYMKNLFNSSSNYVIIFSSNTDDNSTHKSKHVRHRKFTNWILTHAPNWKLVEVIPNKYSYTGDNNNSSFANFHIFKKEN